MTILDNLDAHFAILQLWGEGDVIKGHKNVIANSFAYKRATAARMVSLCSAQDALIDIHVDLKVTLKSRDLRSTVDLNFMRSSYTCFDEYQREYLESIVLLFLL